VFVLCSSGKKPTALRGTKSCPSLFFSFLTLLRLEKKFKKKTTIKNFFKFGKAAFVEIDFMFEGGFKKQSAVFRLISKF
jgi:hypothetical protein